MAKKASFIIVLGLITIFIVGSGKAMDLPKERAFQITYTTLIKDIPKAAKNVRVWLPYPESDESQKIWDVKVESPYPAEIVRDAEYGNAILYLSVENAKVSSFKVEIKFKVLRRESIHGSWPSNGNQLGDPELQGKYLNPTQIGPITERIKKVAMEAAEGKKETMEKARAIYDYVLDLMDYDKSVPGWGTGNLERACDINKGNCTDFHSLFNALAFVNGVPTRFIMGLPIPKGVKQGTIGGYHCWTEFYFPGYGWVPVDISEADKNPSKRDYFFGNLCENRVQLSIGRDILLAPSQKGQRLNFFVYPYAEIDGKPFEGIEKSFAFREF